MILKAFFLSLLFGCNVLLASAQAFKKLHTKSFVIDTHNDFPISSIDDTLKFDSDLRGKAHTDLNRLKEGGVDAQIFSIYCGPEQVKPFLFANRMIDSVYEWVRRNPNEMTIVKSVDELKTSTKQKKIAAMMGVEGGHMMENNLENLQAFYDRGVRYMTLTWNNSTSWATSAQDENEKKDSLPHKGLTDFGRQVVKKMNEMGMLVDVSHVGEQTFADVISISTRPIIASHSCVWSLSPHRRNLKDYQLKVLAKNGGVIHLNFYAGFLDSAYEKSVDVFNAKHKKEIDNLVAQNIKLAEAVKLVSAKYAEEKNNLRPKLSLLIDHLDYIVRLVGIDHVGLGSDFDGVTATPYELNGVQDFPLITQALLERGYSKKSIRKILGGNFLRVLKAAESHP